MRIQARVANMRSLRWNMRKELNDACLRIDKPGSPPAAEQHRTRHQATRRARWRTLATRIAVWVLAAATCSTAAISGVSDQVAPPFIAVRMERTGDVSPSELARALSALGGGSQPQHVVALIHGWDTPQYASTKQYDQIARDLRAEFTARGLRVAVLGVQWASDAGPRRRWVPLEAVHRFFGLLGFPRAVRDPYAGLVPRARATGRQGVRRLLLAVHDRYPEARLHLYAHSMGAEVALHAVRPQANSARDGDAVIFSPQRTLEVDVLALAGADLDEDVALGWKATALPSAARSPRLWWLTVPEPDGSAGRDRVLVLRKVARGKRAIGNVVPRLRAEQIDDVLGARSLVFDTHRIPRNHDILAYYSRERLASLAGAAGELQAQCRHTSPLLETLDRVLAAPDDRAALQPYLETGESTVTLYALWRLERHYCGDSRHLENGYLLHIGRLAHTHPERLEQERAASPCRVVREGIWPGIHGRTGLRAGTDEGR